MKKIIIYSFGLIPFLFGCNNTHKKVTKYYESGKIQLEEWVKTDNTIDGPSVMYYPNGKIKGLAIVKDGEVNGKVVTYYENGMLKSLVSMKDTKIKEGHAYRFFENGRLKALQVNVNDTTCYEIAFDSSGNLISKDRMLYIEPITTTVYPGDTFFAYIRWYGPRDFSSYSFPDFDFRNESLSEEENKQLRLSHEMVPMYMSRTLDYTEIKIKIIPDKPGKHRFWGDILFEDGSPTKHYQHFEGEFNCTPAIVQ